MIPRPRAAPSQSRASLADIAGKLLRIERSLAELEAAMGHALDRVAGDHHESAKNLVHYVALRQHDLRELQLQLYASDDDRNALKEYGMTASMRRTGDC